MMCTFPFASDWAASLTIQLQEARENQQEFLYVQKMICEVMKLLHQEREQM